MKAPIAVPPTVLYVDLARVFLAIAVISCVVWIVDYSRTGWWRNPVGQNLVVKTSLLTLLLSLSLLASLLRLSPVSAAVIRWADLGLVALIGPVMMWRVRVFHRVGLAIVRCPAGHPVSVASKFCPACGLLLPPAPSRRLAARR